MSSKIKTISQMQFYSGGNGVNFFAAQNKQPSFDGTLSHVHH